MLLTVTVLVFLLTAAITTAIGLRAWDWRGRALERLDARAPIAAPILPSPALLWRELAGRIGTAVPASAKELPVLKRRLIRAGFRNHSAALIFHGIRLLGTVLAGSIALFLALRSSAPVDKLLIVTAAGALVGYMAPGQYLAVQLARRKHAIEKGLPNALDLMVVCVESGLGLDQTLLQVSKELQWAHPEICEEFAVMNLELRAGKRRHEALHNLADRTGVEDMKKLVAVLVQTDRFGTSISQALRSHSDYLRILSRQRAEERAAKLAVKLVFPIFFCVLPSLFIVTIGPVITRLVRDLLPMIENM